MDKHSNYRSPSDSGLIEKLRAELDNLDREPVTIDGKTLKPSQCYRFDLDPVHVLFNTNCPDDLKVRIVGILSKYLEEDEGRTPQ